jgi:cytoskeletal protein CcmA (bactofilin family)
MSDPRDHVSDLTTDDARLNRSSTRGEFADSLSHTSSYFETWLEDLKPAFDPRRNLAPQELVVDDRQPAGEFRFEGNLRIDGYARGQLRSLTGTLILGEAAEVESDIVVAAAIIDGSLRGDVRATERVELLSHARVIGKIESPAITVSPGAVFEGECHFLPAVVKSDSEDSNGEESRVMKPVLLESVSEARA